MNLLNSVKTFRENSSTMIQQTRTINSILHTLIIYVYWVWCNLGTCQEIFPWSETNNFVFVFCCFHKTFQTVWLGVGNATTERNRPHHSPKEFPDGPFATQMLLSKSDCTCLIPHQCDCNCNIIKKLQLNLNNHRCTMITGLWKLVALNIVTLRHGFRR